MLGYLLVAATLIAQADAAADAELERKIGRLVRQMDADVQTVRDQAEEKIIELGPAALRFLPLPSDYTGEVKKRLTRIREKLQKDEARQTAQAATVSLQGELPLSQILAKLQEQTGNKIVDFRKQLGQQPSDPKIKVDFEKTPFWQAMDHLLEKAELGFYPYAEGASIGLMSREEGTAPSSGRLAYQGPFRFEPAELQITRDLRRTDAHDCKLRLYAYWEPRLQPIVLYFDPAQFSAVDDLGNDLSLSGLDSEIEVPVVKGEVAKDLILPFKPPSREAKKIARLKGKVDVVLPGKIESLEFKNLDPDKKPSIRRGGVTATLTRIFKNNEIWDINIELKFDKTSGALESHRGWVLDNEVILKDPKGNVVELATFEETLRAEDAVGVTYGYELPTDNLKGYTFTYKTPILILKLPVEFELQDLPLP